MTSTQIIVGVVVLAVIDPTLGVIIGVIGTLLGIIATQLVNLLLGKRSRSGDVDTSESVEIWTEGREFRKIILDELKGYKEEVAKLRKDALETFNQTLELRGALADSQAEVREVRHDNHRLRNQIMAAEFALEQERDRADKLEQQLRSGQDGDAGVGSA